MFEVQTGRSDSASWKFVEHLSQIWQRNQVLKDDPQHTASYFVPRHVKGFYKRLQNLHNQRCKLIIAPSKAVTELPIDEMQVKIAVVLWETYLAPVNPQGDNSRISLAGHQTWLIPEDSLIMPSFFDSLKAGFADASTDMEPELVNVVQTLNWPPATTTAPAHVSLDPVENESDPMVVELEPSPDQLNIVQRQTLLPMFAQGLDGPLFVELIGPYRNLLNLAGERYRFSSLDNALIQEMLRYVWFIEPFSIAKLKVRTVGVALALYVHENEDPEFVTELIEVLAQQPKTAFPKPFLLKNLTLNQTKNVSPLFLHQSSIDFFNID